MGETNSGTASLSGNRFVINGSAPNGSCELEREGEWRATGFLRILKLFANATGGGLAGRAELPGIGLVGATWGYRIVQVLPMDSMGRSRPAGASEASREGSGT